MSQFLVTVTAQTRRGRTNLHTFGIQSEAEHLGWFVETPASRKQLKERTMPGLVLPTSWPPSPRREIGARYYGPIGTGHYGPTDDGPIHLASGVDVPRRTLTVILDALRSGEKHEVDVRYINFVVSQLGSRIAQLDTLDSEQRRHAEGALYAEILRRCTSL